MDQTRWNRIEEILQAAPESPWQFPVELFVSRAEASTAPATFSARTATVALPQGGSVLDVGCGAGGASMPLAPGAGRLTGVDSPVTRGISVGKRVTRAAFSSGRPIVCSSIVRLYACINACRL